MFFDSGYMLLGIIGFVLVLIPQLLVKSTYSKYSKIKTRKGVSGAEVAKAILASNGVHNVSVEPTSGVLSDHYDPSKKIIRLSEDIYYGSSVASLGVAAHEVGHAIQDAQGYLPMKLRAGLFPAVQAGQFLGPLLLMAGLGLRFFAGMGGFTSTIALVGIILYASVVIFHVVTLPVEFNASFRAVKALANGGYVVDNEIGGAKKVLTAAAFTYVAVALYALIELIYWINVFFGRKEE